MKYVEYNITNSDGKSNCIIRTFCKMFNEKYNDVFDEFINYSKEYKSTFIML